MAEFETLKLSVDDFGVATLMLNRPDKHNAMSAQMLADLTHAAGLLGRDDTVRVVVLTGSGKTFCAGGDLGWMRAQQDTDRETRKAEARKLANALAVLDALPKPLIGKVQGNAFGGGVGLACVCDVTFGVETAKLGLTETRLGLIPATIGPYVVGRMGLGAARQVFMSARVFGAAEAARLGILAAALPAQDLEAAVEREAAAYLTCAPGAVAAAKSLARSLGSSVDADTIERSIEALADQWDSAEAAAGISAFFDKTPAPWITER